MKWTAACSAKREAFRADNETSRARELVTVEIAILTRMP